MESNFPLANLKDLNYTVEDFEDFKKKVVEVFGKDYKIFGETKSVITEHKYFQDLMSAVEAAKKVLPKGSLYLSDESQMTEFFKMLFREMNITSQMHFETSKSIREKSYHLKPTEVPKILFIVSSVSAIFDEHGIVRDSNLPSVSFVELFSCMASYFSKTRGDLFGIVVTIKGAKIIWIKASESSEEGLKPRQPLLFDVEWLTSSLQNFLLDISKGDDGKISLKRKIPFQQVRNLEVLYIFLDFLSCIVLK